MKKNDRYALYIGLFFLISYFLLIQFKFEFVSEFLEKTLKMIVFYDDHVESIMDNLMFFLEYFFLVIISSFIGIPISKILLNIILSVADSRNSNYFKPEIEKLDNELCKKIYNFLEKTNQINILSKMKKYKISGSFELPSVKNHLHNSISKLFSISEILGSIINSENNEHLHDSYLSYEDNEKLNSINIGLRRFYFEMILFRGATLASLYFTPVSVLIGLCFFRDVYLNGDGFFIFSFGITLLFGALPLIYFFYSLISYISILTWRKYGTKYDDLVFKIFVISICLIFFLLIIASGIKILEGQSPTFISLISDCCNYPLSGKVSNVSESYKLIRGIIISLTIPFIKINDLYNISNLFNTDIVLVLRIASVITVSYLIGIVIKFLITQYEEFSYDESSTTFMLPPELANIFGMFVNFIVFSGLLYSSFISYLSGQNQLGTLPTPEPVNLTDLVPFTVFIAMIGAILAISTKDFMENYFSGLSMRINMPFEENDRVTVGSSGMMSVDSIGLRATTFYGISENTLTSIPHKELAKQTIHNFTHPTLYYRRKIIINIPDHRFLKREHYSTSLQAAEGILLLVAYLTPGVRRPDSNKDIGSLLDIELESIQSLTEKINISLINFNVYIKNISSVHGKELNGSKRKRTELKAFDAEFEKIIDKSESNGVVKIHNYKEKINTIVKMSQECILISYFYYECAMKLWHEKESTDILSEQKRLDNDALALLDAPRVTSKQRLTGNGDSYWEVALEVTLSLSEQSDEIIHHINLWIIALWGIFGLPDKTKID